MVMILESKRSKTKKIISDSKNNSLRHNLRESKN